MFDETADEESGESSAEFNGFAAPGVTWIQFLSSSIGAAIRWYQMFPEFRMKSDEVHLFFHPFCTRQNSMDDCHQHLLCSMSRFTQDTWTELWTEMAHASMSEVLCSLELMLRRGTGTRFKRNLQTNRSNRRWKSLKTLEHLASSGWIMCISLALRTWWRLVVRKPSASVVDSPKGWPCV